MNSAAPWPGIEASRVRVLHYQRKLHRWAEADPAKVFDDLYNLVVDRATLVVAWERVRTNKGSRTAGLDGQTAPEIERRGVERFLAELHTELKARTFRPVGVRERAIPKPGGKFRRLGIPTVRDRVVQAALKLVLEPIFESDLQPCSYGFRPQRRAQDAVTEIVYLATRTYEWVVEADIEACFDRIDHSALMERLRRRVSDRRVLRLVKAFLAAGVMTHTGLVAGRVTGTPQGGILSPLLANIALSVLDDHYAHKWAAMGASQTTRWRRQQQGAATYRLIRYADDFVVVVKGTRADAETQVAEASAVLGQMGLTLSPAKTSVVHIDEGFDFLGFRIQRHTKQGTRSRYVYTYPSAAALRTVMAKIKTLTRRRNVGLSLAQLCRALNPLLRGWCNYFRHGASKRTFNYLRAYVWERVVGWLRKKHPDATWRWLRSRYLPRWWPTDGDVELFNPASTPVTRYRYRGKKIASPWHPEASGYREEEARFLERLEARVG